MFSSLSFAKVLEKQTFNPIQDGLFQECLQVPEGDGGWVGKATLLKVFRTYPRLIKLGTVIPYLKKTRKRYESRDIPLGFCWQHNLFTGNQKILPY